MSGTAGDAGDPADTLGAIEAVWKRFLQLDTLESGKDFYELGGNSMLMVRMLVQVRTSFGCDINYTAFLASPFAATLADLVDEALGRERPVDRS